MSSSDDDMSSARPASNVDRAVMNERERHGASDAALVVRVARYQQHALAELYRRHSGAVFALSRRLLSDRTLAEEVVQEVFVRLWNNPDRFDPDRGSLRTYLLAQCHGRSVDLIRSEESRRQRENKEVRLAAEAGYDLEHEVLDLTVASRVREALGSIPANEREPILLAYFGGHTYREVAELLGEPEGTIKSRIRSGLKRLRAGLAGVAVSG